MMGKKSRYKPGEMEYRGVVQISSGDDEKRVSLARWRGFLYTEQNEGSASSK